jgi:hypothetical protein
MTACTKSALVVYAIRANNKRCRRVVVTGAGKIPASRSALGVFRECRKRHARPHSRQLRAMGYGLLRTIPGGLTIYPPLADQLGFARRIGMRLSAKPPRKVLVTSGRLAGTMRLQPPQVSRA